MQTSDCLVRMRRGYCSPVGSFPERWLRVNGFPASLFLLQSEDRAKGAGDAGLDLYQVSLRWLPGAKTPQVDAKT
jgi:hypothetical protein